MAEGRKSDTVAARATGRKRKTERRERTRRKKKRHHRPGSSESEQDEGLAKRGVALGSGNPGLPISSLLLIHSNCICSQIYILFSGFPPSIRSSATTTTTTTKHARVCACLCRRRNVHTHVKRRACICAEMERTKSRVYILFERVTRRIVSSRSPRRRRSSESLSVPRSVSIFLGKFTQRI